MHLNFPALLVFKCMGSATFSSVEINGGIQINVLMKVDEDCRQNYYDKMLKFLEQII